MVNSKDVCFYEMNEQQRGKSIVEILDIFVICFGLQEKMIQKVLLKEYLRILNTDLKELNLSDIRHVYMTNDITFQIIANPSLKELISPLKAYHDNKVRVKNEIDTFEIEYLTAEKQKEEKEKAYLNESKKAYQESLKHNKWVGNDFQLRTLFVKVFNSKINEEQKEKAYFLRNRTYRKNQESLNAAIVARQDVDRMDYNTLPLIYFESYIVISEALNNKQEI